MIMKRFTILLLVSLVCLSCGPEGEPGNLPNINSGDESNIPNTTGTGEQDEKLNTSTGDEPNIPDTIGTDEQGKEEPTDSGKIVEEFCIMPSIPNDVHYQVKVVNNTGSEITVFPYTLEKGKNGISLGIETFFKMADDMSAFEFGFPVELREACRFYEPDTPDELIEAEINSYLPTLLSFFLKITVDDAEYYLAGWPRSVDLPPLIDGQGYSYAYGGMVDFTLDTGKIVQYGIGYSENKKIRYKNELIPNLPYTSNAYLYGGMYRLTEEERALLRGPPRAVKLAYAPMIVNYENDGRTEEYDFDFIHTTVHAKAVLTIDGPDKIEFKTTEMRTFSDGKDED